MRITQEKMDAIAVLMDCVMWYILINTVIVIYLIIRILTK